MRSYLHTTITAAVFLMAGLGIVDIAQAAGFIPAAPLVPARRTDTTTLLSSGKVLVTGGAYSPRADMYDPASDSWSQMASLDVGRAGASATLLESGLVLVAGGSSNAGVYQVSCELYDPATNTWSQSSPMADSRSGHTATRLPSGKVLVVGGWKVSNAMQTKAELYDPNTNRWTPAGTLTTPRSNHTATLLRSGRVLIAGGRNIDGYVASAELYDPVTNSWSSAGSLTEERYSHTATLLNSGRVLVTGGNTFSGRISSTEVYDPATNQWAGSAPLATARDVHTATLLPSGKVLVVGGYDFPNVIGTAELYDPDSETWISAGTLLAARLVHTATLLESGRVLIASGRSVSGPLASVELYAPETTTVVSTSPVTTVVGQVYAVNVSVFGASGTPSGRVLVNDGAGSTCGPVVLSNGTGSCSLRSMSAGQRTLTVTYAPDSGAFAPSTATATHQVERADTTTSGFATPNTAVWGQSVIYTAHVSDVAPAYADPAGPVVFSDGTNSCTATVTDGAASCSLVPSRMGSYAVSANYLGDDNTKPSSSSIQGTLQKAYTSSVMLPITPSSVVVGEPVTLNADVYVNWPGGGPATGMVSINNGRDGCGAAVDSDGRAACVAQFRTAGWFTNVHAAFLGDDHYYPSNSGNVSLVVNSARTTTAIVTHTPATSAIGETVTFVFSTRANAPSTGVPTGSVTVSDGQQSCAGSLDTAGNGSCAIAFVSAGVHRVVARYGGAMLSYDGSSSPGVDHVVDPLPTTLSIVSISPSATVTGQDYVVAVAVTSASDTPTGHVTIDDGQGSSCGPVVLTNGAGSCSLPSTEAGGFVLTATYTPDSGAFAPSSATAHHAVNRAETTLAIVEHTPERTTPAQPVTITAALAVVSPGAGTPSGPVTVGDGVDSCTIAAGATQCALTLSTRGVRTLAAHYAGDANFIDSSAQVTHHVNRLPVAGETSYATNADSALTVQAAQGVLAQASDPDGDALTVENAGTLSAGGIGGTVVLNADGGFVYTPPAWAHGVATFEYKLGDGFETVSATATITVDFVNHAPHFALAPSPKWPAGASGARTHEGFATVTDFGAPNEADQHVLAWHLRPLGDPGGIVSNATIALDGALSYTLSGRAGRATFGVRLQDDGGTANGGQDTSDEQTFTITVAAGLDLSVSLAPGIGFLHGGGPYVYEIAVHNAGPNDAIGARVQALLPFNLVDAVWACAAASPGAHCGSGVGDLDDFAHLPSGATIHYELGATVLADPEAAVAFTVTVTPPAGVPDLDESNNSATRIDPVGVYADGFDRGLSVDAGGGGGRN